MGNDSAWYSNVANQCYFNPRSRVGNDLQWFVLGLIELLFQSTFPRGERRDAAFTKVFADNFNPRSRVGNDLIRRVELVLILDFNPRSRVGNDTCEIITKDVSEISIHVPAWGTTLKERAKDLQLRISIHVPAWGTTREKRGKA